MKNALAKFPDVIKAADGKKVLGPKQVKEIRSYIKRASDRSRQSVVLALLMQGVGPAQLSRFLLLDEDTIKADYENAVLELQQEMEDLPQGPLLLAKVVLEGYGRFTQRIMKSVHTSIEAIEAEEEPDHITIERYYRLGLDALDRLTDRMEKYGLLPIAPKTTRSQGGVRNP
ncbi:MAG: hypothetical protein JSU72_15745, partial [Deltaproteobacteria bacterium]